jgi:hypothetical protein
MKFTKKLVVRIKNRPASRQPAIPKKLAGHRHPIFA